VIRRLFWLLAGAVLGVTGYRRAGRFARSLRPASAARPAARMLRAAPGQGRRGQPPSPGREAAGSFLLEVRDGMDEYLDRHAAGSPTLEGQQRDLPPPRQQLPPPFPARSAGNGGRFRFNHAKDGR
jgi:hypothetical protein